MPNWKKVIVSGSSAHLNQITGSGGVKLPDAVRLNFGDANDMKIYHSGTHSIIQDTGTGNLEIKGSIVKLRGTAGGDSMGVFTEDGGVELYYDNSKKLDVLTGGVTVTGKMISDSAHIDDTTTSTSKTTGALTVDGGVGVAENIHAGGDVVAYASSDERLKDNIEVIKGSLNKVGEIRGVTFDWNEESPEWAKERGRDVGVIAQEVRKVLPEIVVERTNGYLGVDYKRIIPLLIESIKELKQEVEDLKKKVN